MGFRENMTWIRHEANGRLNRGLLVAPCQIERCELMCRGICFDMTLLSRQVPFVTPGREFENFPLAKDDDSRIGEDEWERDNHETTTQAFLFFFFFFFFFFSPSLLHSIFCISKVS